MTRIFVLLVILSTVVSFSGCSGKAHQAPLPDYSDMTDEGPGPDEARE